MNRNQRSRKRVLLLGGFGLIGTILCEYLMDRYNFHIVDIKAPNDKSSCNYTIQDVSKFSSFLSCLPPKQDAIVNLVGIPSQPPVVNTTMFDRMIKTYIKCTYNSLLAAVLLEIPKIVFASSNHVTDAYELNGRSLLGRKISSSDYPLSNGVYGTMKLCAENLGFVFSQNYGIKVINLRIGTVRNDEARILASDIRSHHTILSKLDTVGLFTAAIETERQYGTYYASSTGDRSPWDTSELSDELKFYPDPDTISWKE